jgi:paraquat-inducible protein B
MPKVSIDHGTPRARTVSVSRKSHWPGWIWAVPLAALGIVIWLMVRQFSARSFDVSVTFEDATGLKAKSTKVLYRGVEVGEVASISLSADRTHVEVHLDIHHDMKSQVTTGTRFYLQGTQPSFSDLSSLKALLSGPSILMVPGTGAAKRHFAGIMGKPRAPLAVSVTYVTDFAGAVGDLHRGAPVVLRGFKIGEVDKVQLSTDLNTGTITTSAVLLLDPTLFHLQSAPPADGDWAALMNAALSKLVQESLRARLTKDPPFIGPAEIELDFVPGVPPATLVARGEYLQIPSVESGGIEDLSRKLGQLPITQIGENVRAITAHMKGLVSSPKLNESIDHLDHALAQAEKVLNEAEPQIKPTLNSIHRAVDNLQRAAGEIDRTIASARKVIGAAPVSADGNMEQMLRELSGAARSIRTLAEYLDQHPEALIKGRSREGSTP